MLRELRVENLVLIEEAHLEFAPGLNVLTGETGAGKTMLAQSLDLLLGGRSRAGLVRPGASEAYVEGVFDLPDEVPAELAEVLAADAGEVVLARRLSDAGRTRALLNGRTITVGQLRAIAESLISFYGQHEHRRLTLAAAQLDILDSFCGPEQLELRARCARAYARMSAARAALAELDERDSARERELDLLGFELGEIEAADPSAGEYEELVTERERLRHSEALRGAAWTARLGLSGAEDDEDGGSAARLAGAVVGLEAVAGVDAALDALAERVRALSLEAADLGVELARYAEGVEGDPGRLDAVESRLEVLDRLIRKHGGDGVAGVLAHAQSCRERREEILGTQAAREEAAGGMAAAGEELGLVAGELRAARVAAAPALSAAVVQRLGALAMDGATFEIVLEEREPGPAGGDGVEFVIAPNAGVPAGPLREIASGGECSRVMLALMGVASEGGAGVLVFDEVDAGIGGRTAHAVGAALRELAAGRQVVCITHLPQVASVADRHFSIVKEASGSPARTLVRELGSEDVVGELVRMLGSDEDDRAAREHAEELLRAA